VSWGGQQPIILAVGFTPFDGYCLGQHEFLGLNNESNFFFFFFFFGFRNSQPKQRTHIGFNKKPKTKPKFAQPNKALDILHFTLGLLHGLLVIVHSNEYLDYASYAVWVMKEYRVVQSWTQLYDIFVGTHDKVITFTKSAEVLV
jgi:hypothetical protein